MDTNNKNILTIGSLIVAIIILAGLGFWVFKSPNKTAVAPTITNFEECAAAGYPLTQSYPRQCRTPNGDVFVETMTASAPKAVATGGCFIGGCSSQICSDQQNAASTCEYKEEYACYKTGRCERQASGQCGWTQSPELATCINAVLNTNPNLK